MVAKRRMAEVRWRDVADAVVDLRGGHLVERYFGRSEDAAAFRAASASAALKSRVNIAG